MESNVLKKLLHNVKDKIKLKKKNNTLLNEYAFSNEDLDELNKDNYKKIKELKDITLEKEKEEEIELNDSILVNNKQEEEENKEEENSICSLKEILVEEEPIIEEAKPKISYINLEEKEIEIIMNKWQEIDSNIIDKDIIEGKDLLNHNYTITYADDAERFIHQIRKKYEVVICYLIGFNNEKKGIFEKTYFSNKKDNEWKYLNQYIKILEKIRNFKLQ